MKNNWKEEFDKEFTHNKYGKFWSTDGLGYEVAPEEVKNFIESLLTKQKKELVEEALAREKLLVDMHRIELDAISCMSLERFIKWSDDRKNKESLKHHD